MGSVKSTNNPLGKLSAYPGEYDASLLFPIDRDESWQASGQTRNDIQFYGVDIWNGYEVSWLNEKGKPVVCCGEFRVPANSQFLIESKSFKLYLNSYNQTRFANAEDARERMINDLSAVAGAEVEVTFHTASSFYPDAPEAELIDDIEVDIHSYEPDASLLTVHEGEYQSGWLVSHLLKSNCPVTGQPDWGSLYIYYEGDALNRQGLLAYIVSLRQHQDFHEQCVERTFRDIQERCKPKKLTVYARYVRRGGLDINPFRSSEKKFQALNFRSFRQ